MRGASGEAPGQAATLRGVAAISVGGGQTCSLLSSGQLRCVGADSDGQLGDGAPLTDQALPVVVRAS